MIGRYCLIISFCLTISLPALGGDLYLARIDNREAMEGAGKIIDHAHGVIDGKFIVNIDKQQVKKLTSLGISLELLTEDCSLESYYLISHPNRERAITPAVLPAKYSTANRHLAELDKGSVDVLARDGYLVIPIARRETPLYYKPPMISAPRLDYYPTDTLAELVDQDTLRAHVQKLQDFRTRFILSDSIHTAALWIKNRFLGYGYTDVSNQHFGVTSDRYGYDLINYPCYNVLCVKVGTTKPDRLVVIGAHYDSFNFDDPTYGINYAPGADDNATGTAAVLELARIFKDVETEKTFIFSPFSAEEWGLFGADHLAMTLSEDSADVEMMLNFDMVAHEGNAVPDVDIYAGLTMAYYQVFADAAERVSGLVPMYAGTAASSDDRAFNDYGFYSVCAHERDYNTRIHSNYDLINYLDFSYMKNIVGMTAASLCIIDAALDPVMCEVYDVGDGRTLRVVWNDCWEDYTYRVLYGENMYSLGDTIVVPPSSCFYDLGGLTEGQEYAIAVHATPPEGIPQLGLNASFGTPHFVPRTPGDFTVDPDSACVVLRWRPNSELDFSHYKLLRMPMGSAWAVLEDGFTDTMYIDSGMPPHWNYTYAILAVDNDQNESDTSETYTACPATFDGGILLIDETQTGGYNPSSQEQEDFFDSAFAGHGYARVLIENESHMITRSQIGQYDPIFWVDDDDTTHLLEGSLDSLAWYFDYDTDFLLAGWETIYTITGQRHFYPGSFYYDNLGITYIAQNPQIDFTGATGLNGWPDLEVKSHPFYQNRLPDIDIFTESAQAEVIYTFDSHSSHPFFADKPVGVALDTYHGKRVVLGFPLYWLTEASARALVTKVLEYFAEESVLYGDVNGDWSLSILDVTYLINYLYKDGPPPERINNADVDNSCAINLLDVTYLINYLYKNGPEPMEGCVN